MGWRILIAVGASLIGAFVCGLVAATLAFFVAYLVQRSFDTDPDVMLTATRVGAWAGVIVGLSAGVVWWLATRDAPKSTWRERG